MKNYDNYPRFIEIIRKRIHRPECLKNVLTAARADNHSSDVPVCREVAIIMDQVVKE